jgi:hypothetical protein
LTLETVTKFEVPAGIVSHTELSLRQAGRKGHERFVLWSGRIDGRRFLVQTAHVPEQTGYRLESGLCVRVEGEALHKLNTWLYENQEMLGAQIHAHPTEAYHSGTDDSFPIVTTLGGLSLVVPYFCRSGLFPGSAAYRLTVGGWRQTVEKPDALIGVF